MNSLWEKYKWHIVRAGLFSLFLLSTVVNYMESKARFLLLLEKYSQHAIEDFSPFDDAGFNINLFALVLVLLYPLVIKYLKNKDVINKVSLWRSKEVAVFSIVLALYCILSLIEVQSVSDPIWFIYVISLLFILLFNWSYFFGERSENKNPQQFKWNNNKAAIFITVVSLSLIFLMIRLKLITETNKENVYEILFTLSQMLLFTIWGYVVISWFIRQWKDIRRLKNENSKAELLHLKSQINPHFFFNTLNNLYGLIKSDQDQARELVLDLSEMMRYTIYKGQKEFVSLENEIDYLEKYIEIHKKRYQKTIEINFNHNLSKENNAYQLMPLLFIILVENAFKHGVENLTSEAFINISLIAEKNSIDFTVENNFDENELPEVPGIGLSNLKRRLELVYPTSHRLNLTRANNIFTAELTLELI